MPEGTSTRVLCGRYEVQERLGSGGMGEVFAAHDLRLGRDVAVKILRPGIASDEAARRRFETEARLAAQLSHPNVVTVFDSGEADGAPFLVMERLPGSTLADAIDGGPLNANDAVGMAVAVLDALAAAHALGIAHRDVKPGNILRTANGQWKVADFGIAKTALDGHVTDQTTTGLVYGTLSYLAPERVAGGPATVATDLYAVGVVLYEALSGRRPVPAGSPPAAYLSPHPEPLSTVRPALPPVVIGVVERALASDPVARFPSASSMADALRGAVGSRPLEPDTVAMPSALARTQAIPAPSIAGRPLKWIAAAAAIVVVLIVIGVALAANHHGSSAAPPTPPTTVAPSSLPAGLEGSLSRLEQLVRR